MHDKTDAGMSSNLLGRAVKGYGVLLALAAAGFIFAQLAAFLCGAIELHSGGGYDANRVQHWTHGGWLLGIGTALVLTLAKWTRRRGADAPDHAAELPSRAKRGKLSLPRGRRLGFVASLLLGGLGGGLLGGMLGGTFLLLWFSLAYSPFAPQDWVASVRVRQEHVAPSVRREPATSTDHPVALLAFFVPLSLGAAGGATLGGIYGVRDVTHAEL